MLDDGQPIEHDEVKKLIDVLKKTDIYDNSKEPELRQIFQCLNIEDKMQVLYETVLSNAAGIADADRKLELFERAEKISVSTWFKKVLITFLAFTGSVALLTFVFMIVKNGAFNDISVVASFFKTMNEVMNVIFLTK